MRPQFSLRWLIAFTLWMGCTLMLNFQPIKQRYYVTSDKVFWDFGRGWPLEFQHESSRTFALIPVDALTSRYEINSPINVVQSERNFSWIPFILNLAFWILLFAVFWFCVTRILALRKSKPLGDTVDQP